MEGAIVVIYIFLIEDSFVIINKVIEITITIKI